MPTSCRGRTSRRGFTLLEMVTVMAIVGIMAAVVFPGVAAGLDSIRLSSASDSIAGFLNGALNRAERRQQVMEISISVRENSIRLASAEPGFERKLEMPQGVRIETVLPAPAEPQDPRTFLLLPGGTPPRVGIGIVNSRGARRMVRVDPMTGVPRIEVSGGRMRRTGFTLLEMMAATLVMGIAVVGLLSGISTSVRNAARLADYDRAVMLARTKLDELLLDRAFPKVAPVEGRFPPELSGGVEGGWRARVTPFDMPPKPSPGTLVIERMELELWWMSGGQRRTFALDGYRTAVFFPREAAMAAPPGP